MDSILREKYKAGGIADSILTDCAIYFISLLEESGKFNVLFYDFMEICNKAQYLCCDLSGNEKLKSIFFEKHIRGLLNEYFDVDNTIVNKPKHKNVYENNSDDCDFMLWAYEESPVFKPCKDYKSNKRLIEDWSVKFKDEHEILKLSKLYSNEDNYHDTWLIRKNMLLFEFFNKSYKKEPEKQLIMVEPQDNSIKNIKTEITTSGAQKNEVENVKTIKGNDQILTIKGFLINNLELIKSGELSVDKANVINMTVQTFIDVAKAELEYMKFERNEK